MTYSKPEISTLGDAARVIQLTNTKDGEELETPVLYGLNPAYDLDD